MGKHAQIIMGPAGSGKSTYTNTMRLHCENTKRRVHCINLDPAAEEFHYPVTIDIQELIKLDDVMEELPYGPNGGLIFAMEFLLNNLEWFHDQLGDYEDDYLLIDCPGQIELYSHLGLMQRFVSSLQEWGYRVCGVYLLDSHFIDDPSKFMAGTLMCLSAMVRLELPHVNVMTKMDLMKNRDDEVLEKYYNPDVFSLMCDLNDSNPRFNKLTNALGTLIEEYNMVGFMPLDRTDESTIEAIIYTIDNAIQYGEDLDLPPPRDLDVEDDETQDVEAFINNM
eukprot:TRINITY_DN4446_c0_g1_i1.p1 TRINITY_DN4446_c0_g1~~TRINITY_DN4446_c0_g1_i1.p1  ORF type:complete len:280 (-),score=60.72 TRINITY_DN4446_c0_g1_i1:253-1092(-)